MKAKYVDVVDVATDDVRGWFEACETESECAELANDMKDVIDTIAATNVERLSCSDDLAFEPTVSYCWTADGESERCQVEGSDFSGEECYHCRRPIDGRGVRLLADDGDVYNLHVECAREGCVARDTVVIDSAIGSPDF